MCSSLVTFSPSILNGSIITGTGLVVTALIQELETKRMIHFPFYDFKYKLTTTKNAPLNLPYGFRWFRNMQST